MESHKWQVKMSLRLYLLKVKLTLQEKRAK